MKLHAPIGQSCSRRLAFTLEEVVISLAISAVALACVISGYLLAIHRAQWAAYRAASQAQALERIEQVRIAKWDPLAVPMKDELITENFPVEVMALDSLRWGSERAFATNRVTISLISASPPLKEIDVESVWNYRSRGPFTNRVVTYRSPH